MDKSESIGKLATDLIKATAEMPEIKLDGFNKFLGTKYSTLGSIIQATKPVLTKYSLAILQVPVSIPDPVEGVRVGVTTALVHSSGEYISDTVYLPVKKESGKTEAQVAGSVISYLRRYGYASILSLYAEDDTDAAPVAPADTATKKQAAPAAKKAPTATKKAPTATKKRSWPQDVVEMLIATGTAENAYAAVGMLNKSNLPDGNDKGIVAAWARQYRSARDAGKASDEAAELANSEYTNYMKSRQEA